MVNRYDLLRDMECWRAERPDEWKMDEFMREVSSREADYASLESLNRELVEAAIAARGALVMSTMNVPQQSAYHKLDSLLTKLKETQ